MASLSAVQSFLNELDKGAQRVQEARDKETLERDKMFQRTVALLPSGLAPTAQGGVTQADPAQLQAFLQGQAQIRANLDPSLVAGPQGVQLDPDSFEAKQQQRILDREAVEDQIRELTLQKERATLPTQIDLLNNQLSINQSFLAMLEIRLLLHWKFLVELVMMRL